MHLEGSFLLTTVLVIARGIRYSIVEDSFVCGGSPVPLNVVILLVTCVLERTVKCVSVGCCTVYPASRNRGLDFICYYACVVTSYTVRQLPESIV